MINTPFIYMYCDFLNYNLTLYRKEGRKFSRVFKRGNKNTILWDLPLDSEEYVGDGFLIKYGIFKEEK